MPRYILLLETLKQNTPRHHLDDPLLTQAITELKKVASFINKGIGEGGEKDIGVLTYLQSLADAQCMIQKGRKREGTREERREEKKGRRILICFIRYTTRSNNTITQENDQTWHVVKSILASSLFSPLFFLLLLFLSFFLSFIFIYLFASFLSLPFVYIVD